MKKISLCPVLLVFLYMGCAYLNGNQRLAEIDSLIVAEDYDSAYHLLHSMDSNTFASGEDKIHYDLLYVKVGCLAGHPLSSDSLLDAVIHYYRDNKNNDRLSDAYYYKAVYEYQRTQYKEAIVSLKTAEDLAKKTDNLRQQCKISEMLSFINGMYENTDLQLQYAKQSLDLSKRIGNKRWIADAYYRVALAYSQQNNGDSARFYTNATTPYIKYVREIDLPYFLANLGCIYKESDPQLARKYFEEALSHKELSKILSHLADVYYCEGNTEEAYRLWKRALATDDPMPKDNIIHNLIEYDLEKGNTDSISDKVNEIIAIRDSIESVLQNNAIRDLQMKFDHEVAMRQQDKKTDVWRTGASVLTIALLLLMLYIVRKKHQTLLDEKERKIMFQEHEKRIQEQQLQMSDCLKQIEELKSTGEDSEKEIETLNRQVKELTLRMEPELQNGFARYVEIKEGGNTSNWHNKDFADFNTYYGAIDYFTVYRMRKVKREERLTENRLFYLILKHMKKNDDEIIRIMCISKTTLRSYRLRTKTK